MTVPTEPVDRWNRGPSGGFRPTGSSTSRARPATGRTAARRSSVARTNSHRFGPHSSRLEPSGAASSRSSASRRCRAACPRTGIVARARGEVRGRAMPLYGTTATYSAGRDRSKIAPVRPRPRSPSCWPGTQTQNSSRRGSPSRRARPVTARQVRSSGRPGACSRRWPTATARGRAGRRALAEPSLLDLVEYLETWISDAPVLVLCNARPTLLDGRPGWGRSATSETLDLRPLPADQAEELVAALAGEQELSDALRGRIVAVAEGNAVLPRAAPRLPDRGCAVRRDRDRPAVHRSASREQATTGSRPGIERLIERAAIVGRDFARSAVMHLTTPDEARRP